MLQKDPSTHAPWTKTIFGVVVLVVVAFVVVICCVLSAAVEVLLSRVLAKPEYGVKVKLAISVVVRNNRITKLVFC